MIFAIGTRWKRFVAGVQVVLLLAAPVPSIKEASAESYITGSSVYAPPTTGPYAYYATYGAFGPDQSSFPRVGESFTDPVFGRPITRLTNELGQGSFSEIYSKNGYFNANGSLVHHRTPSGHNIISTSTGQVVRAGVTFNYDSSFAPDDPDAWYYFGWGETTLYKYSVSTGNRVAVKTFPGALGQLGGSIDWIDRTGRYMVLNIGGVTRVYDKQSDTLYAGSIPGSYGGGNGWRGISPDGNYVITSTDGSPGSLSHSWKVDHVNKAVSTTPVLFWTACGGHADVVSASNGKTYFVSFDCHTSISIYAVDVTLPQSASNVAQQLSQNRKLVQLTSWHDSGHFSRVSKGSMQDWMYVSVESGDDGFSAPVSGWRAFKQEIMQVNVLTGEIRRLAHHRSRGLSSGSYYAQPRVSATWDGSVVLWTSNFGHSGTNYADLYGMKMSTVASAPAPAPAPPPAPTPSPLALTFSNPGSGATVSGTATVTVQASGGSGTGYNYSVSVGGATVYTGSGGAFSWNTTNTGNGSVTLVAKVTDSAGASAQTSRTVTVSNTTSSGGGSTTDTVLPTVSMTSPTGTVWTGASIRVAASATDNVGLARIELWGGGKVFATLPCSATTCSGTTWWVTAALPPGSYTVNAVAVDKAGNRTRSAAVTIIKDATSPTYASGAPASSTTTTSGTTAPSTGTTSPTTGTTSPTTGTTSPTTGTTSPTTGTTSPTTGTTSGGGGSTTDTVLPTVSMTSPTGTVWTGASIRVAASATDNVGLARIELWGGGKVFATLPCSTTTCSGTTWWTTGPLPPGSYTVNAVAVDTAGNRTRSAAVTIIKDATSPTYTSGAPASSTTTTTGTTSPTTSTTSPTTGTTSPTTGTTSPTTSTDTTAPTVAITGPPSGVWTGASLQVSMMATDNVRVTKIDLYANGQYATTLPCASASCSGTVTWWSAPFPSGKHTLTAVATDAAGNRTTSASVLINK